jgi:hypothetical protein
MLKLTIESTSTIIYRKLDNENESDGSSTDASSNFDPDSIRDIAEDLSLNADCLIELDPLIAYPVLNLRHKPTKQGIQVNIDSHTQTDTQTDTQLTIPESFSSLSREGYTVEEEIANGVWGYLLPLDHRHGGNSIVLKNTIFSPEQTTSESKFQGSSSQRDKKLGDVSQLNRTTTAQSKGFIIGRHQECGKSGMISL